jgi:hypothetical protein
VLLRPFELSKLLSSCTARVVNGVGGFGVDENDKWSPASRGRKNSCPWRNAATIITSLVSLGAKQGDIMNYPD